MYSRVRRLNRSGLPLSVLLFLLLWATFLIIWLSTLAFVGTAHYPQLHDLPPPSQPSGTLDSLIKHAEALLKSTKVSEEVIDRMIQISLKSSLPSPSSLSPSSPPSPSPSQRLLPHLSSSVSSDPSLLPMASLPNPLGLWTPEAVVSHVKRPDTWRLEGIIYDYKTYANAVNISQRNTLAQYATKQLESTTESMTTAPSSIPLIAYDDIIMPDHPLTSGLPTLPPPHPPLGSPSQLEPLDLTLFPPSSSSSSSLLPQPKAYPSYIDFFRRWFGPARLRCVHPSSLPSSPSTSSSSPSPSLTSSSPSPIHANGFPAWTTFQHRAQHELFSHQFPTTCKNKKFMIVEPYRAGIGAMIAVLATQLATVCPLVFSVNFHCYPSFGSSPICVCINPTVPLFTILFLIVYPYYCALMLCFYIGYS